jgi:F0F1-type ATP synthase membrane subunit a
MMNFLVATANPLEHVLPHEFFPVWGLHWITNQMVMATVAAGLMLLIFPRLFRQADPSAPHGARNFFESILEFLRVEVFRPALKENTDRFLPFLWTLFFFILFSNLLGSIPLGDFFNLIGVKSLAHFGGTATGTMSTTVTLAVVSFFVIHASGVLTVFRALRDGNYGHHEHHEEHSSDGVPPHETAQDMQHMRGDALAADVPGDMRAIGNPTAHYRDDEHLGDGHGKSGQGLVAGSGGVPMDPSHAAVLSLPLYLWNFAPHPFKPEPGKEGGSWVADIPVWALLLVLELVGALIKPFALSIRLFANMIAGHIVLASLIMVVVMAPTFFSQFAIWVPVAALSLLIRFLELFVAFLQAYIFTFLTTLFLASAVAPEH